MHIDTKYFVPFILIVATVSAILIGYFTIYVRQQRHQQFLNRMAQQDSLKYQAMPVITGSDSLAVVSFDDSYVVLDFWATWTASFSEKAHEQLAKLKRKYPRRLEILAAVVQDKRQKVKSYISRYDYPFHYVNGTKAFEKFGLPGVPIQLVFSPEGEVISVFAGRADAARLDSLNEILSDG